MDFSETIIPLALFAAVFGILYVFFMTRNKERLALIEKGADASLFRSNFKLRMGYKLPMLLVGAGMGLLVGSLLADTVISEEGVAYFSMMLTFGGLGLVVGGLIDKKNAPKEEE